MKGWLNNMGQHLYSIGIRNNNTKYTTKIYTTDKAVISQIIDHFLDDKYLYLVSVFPCKDIIGDIAEPGFVYPLVRRLSEYMSADVAVYGNFRTLLSEHPDASEFINKHIDDPVESLIQEEIDKSCATYPYLIYYKLSLTTAEDIDKILHIFYQGDIK